MATIEIGYVAPAGHRLQLIGRLWRHWQLQLRRRLRLHRRHRLHRLLANADARLQRDLGIAPQRAGRHDWMMELARRG